MIKLVLSPLFISILLILFAQVGLLFCWKKLKYVNKIITSVTLVGLVILVVMSLPIVAHYLYYPLKKQFPIVKSVALKEIDIVVVLRGGGDYSRIIQGILSFKNSKASLLVLSGTAGDKFIESPEKDPWRIMAVRLDIPPGAIRTEYLSRNTFEHPLELLKIYGVNKDSKVGIVTSSWHMPRAMSEFKRYFTLVTPIPVEYKFKNLDWVSMPWFPQVDALNWSTLMLHEYIGYVWYSIKYLWL